MKKQSEMKIEEEAGNLTIKRHNEKPKKNQLATAMANTKKIMKEKKMKAK